MTWTSWRLISRRVAGVTSVVAALAATAACSASEGIPVAEDPSSVEITAGPDGVVLVLGSYNIGENIDEFVSGPDLTIYGDGSVYRDTARLDGGAPTRFQRGEISERRLTDIVAASRELPAVPEVVGCGDDEGPTLLVIETRTWSDCGLSDAPDFRTFLKSVHDEMNSLDMTTWVPSAIVEHQPLGGPCAVVESSGLPLYQTAPVYPHAADRFPLGTFECPWG